MDNADIKPIVFEWLKKAQEDEAGAKAIIKVKAAPSTACFLSQQLAEKCLKGLLSFYAAEIPKIHDLINLESLLIKFAPELDKMHGALTTLNRYYIETRYPGDAPEGFTWKEAEEALAAALKIKDFVYKKIGV